MLSLIDNSCSRTQCKSHYKLPRRRMTLQLFQQELPPHKSSLHERKGEEMFYALTTTHLIKLRRCIVNIAYTLACACMTAYRCTCRCQIQRCLHVVLTCAPCRLKGLNWTENKPPRVCNRLSGYSGYSDIRKNLSVRIAI